MPGGPAEATGKIGLGDELLTVDGHDVLGQTLPDIVNLIWWAILGTCFDGAEFEVLWAGIEAGRGNVLERAMPCSFCNYMIFASMHVD
jgi:hypothetical protein